MIKMESPISLEAGSSPVPLQAPAHSDSTSSSGLSPSSMDNNSGPLSSGAGTPTMMTVAAAAAAASSSRRPPRKSTLTQQQKNQKRQRATQDQLSTLEHEFNKNPTPGAEVRIQIANEINMTERSVQIWFQNRRAKIKLMAKKSLETGEDIDSIPESMRAYLAMQAIESGKGIGAVFLGRTGLGPHHGSGPWGSAVDGSSHAKVVITHLSCQSLSIGRWTRVSQNKMGLIIFYSAEKSTMTYYINNDQAGYKIEYPFSFIKNIQLDNGDADPAGRGGIIIELTSQPYFFMDSSPTAGGFCHTGDFTEDQQASQCLVHRLGGHPNVLSGQLAKLVSLEAFQQRHSPAPMPMPMAMPMPMPPTPSDPVGAMFDHRPMPMSAPVSPTNRPSSQPSFGPPAHIGMFQESWGIPNPHSNHHLAAHPHHSAMRAPGHKRQRSRSVPGPVDFSMYQPPMPSFYIQQPTDLDHHDSQQQHHHQHHQHQSPDIYSPVPQQPSAAMGPGGLRIDTQATLGLDARQYPVSAAATTVHSPAEFPSPGFFSQGPDGSATFGTPYSGVGDGGFLSPMANAASLIAPSVSPLSFASHTEPSIVEQSPPLSILGRPGSSADLYGGMDGSCAVSDDGTGLNELYSKHTINMSMPHSPGYSESGHGDIDMSQLVSFDHVDAAGLSPESMPQMHHHHHQHHQHHHHHQH